MQHEPEAPSAEDGWYGPTRAAADGVGADATTRRRAAVEAWLVVVLYLALLAVTLWMDARIYAVHAPQAGRLAWLGWHGPWLGPFIVFAAVGATIVSRRPRNLIGRLMLLSAIMAVVGELVRTYVKLVLGDGSDGPVAMVLITWPFMAITVLGIFLGVVVVPLVFPDGHLLSQRWRVVPWGIGLTVLLMIVKGSFSPRLSDGISLRGGETVVVYDLANPLADGAMARVAAVLPEASLLLALLAVAAAAAVVVRFRRSRGVERQQMKWFVFAAALVAVMAVGLVLLELLAGRSTVLATLSMLVVGLSAYPVAVGVAVLRYRLYEIDRIISRTVSYGLVLAVLGGVYIAGVVGLGATVTAVTGQQDSDLVVAVSTLAVAGLFGPVRTRVQTAVDRRFNRTGYEARRAVEAFTRDVLDEVDLEQIRRHLVETAAVATQPAHVSVWLTDGDKTE